MEIVDYSDSPHSLVEVSSKLREKMFGILCCKIGNNNVTPIGKHIGVEPKALKGFINGNKNIVKTVETIREFCKISKEEIRKSIVSLDGIERPNIPLDFDCKEGARLDAGIYNEGRIRSRSVEYTNKDKEVLNIIVNCGKKIIGKEFNPAIGFDKRVGTYCIYFPPYFAKHYVKLGIAENTKKKLKTGIPDYIMKNKELQRVWFQGTLSEDGCLYAFILFKKKYGYYLYPRIQINRAVEIQSNLNLPKNRIFYKHNLPTSLSYYRDSVDFKLTLDEAKALESFDIKVKPYFSKLYISNVGAKTCTNSILITKAKDLENWYDNIGFELKRQKEQLNLLLNSRGNLSKSEVENVMLEFYSKIPRYLRDKRKIEQNRWLNKDYKERLLSF